MTTYVTKAGGKKEAFQKEKIVRTCLRMGASIDLAENTADKIDEKVKNGVRTKKIMNMIFDLMAQYKPGIQYVINLRKALAVMNPKPDFEKFIRALLDKKGYSVSPNQIINGKCGEHEIDGIIQKNAKTLLLEVKHHYSYHTRTGLDEVRIARAVFEDITEGAESGANNLSINGIIVVCNTKLSDHALKYAQCRHIDHIGWSSPPGFDLATLIGETQLYPITYVKEMDESVVDELSSTGVVLLNQLVERDFEELKKKTSLPTEKLKSLRKKAQTILDIDDSVADTQIG